MTTQTWPLWARFSLAELAEQPWIGQLLDIERVERKRRSLDRRHRNAKIGVFKPMDRFDWSWPGKIDREAIEELFSLSFIEEAANAILLGPNEQVTLCSALSTY